MGTISLSTQAIEDELGNNFRSSLAMIRSEQTVCWHSIAPLGTFRVTAAAAAAAVAQSFDKSSLEVPFFSKMQYY